jgi:hypothetical protein
MARFRIPSVLAVALLASCGAVQSLRPGDVASTSSGTHFDVDINGNVIVADREMNVLRKLSKDLQVVKEIGGTGWSDNQFDQPAGVWARNGIDVFVADYGNHRVQRFDRNLAFVSSFSTRDRPNPNERFGYPTDVAVSRLGDLFICDGENSRILKVTGLSNVERTFGGFDAGKGRLRKPNRIEIGPHDNVYVQDGSRVVVFDNFGNFIRILGEGTLTESARIVADDAGLTALDKGILYFFDREDRLVLDVPLATLFDGRELNVQALAFSRGVAYVLTTEGMMISKDPREMVLDRKQ